MLAPPQSMNLVALADVNSSPDACRVWTCSTQYVHRPASYILRCRYWIFSSVYVRVTYDRKPRVTSTPAAGETRATQDVVQVLARQVTNLAEQAHTLEASIAAAMVIASRRRLNQWVQQDEGPSIVAYSEPLMGVVKANLYRGHGSLYFSLSCQRRRSPALPLYGAVPCRTIVYRKEALLCLTVWHTDRDIKGHARRQPTQARLLELIPHTLGRQPHGGNGIV